MQKREVSLTSGKVDAHYSDCRLSIFLLNASALAAVGHRGIRQAAVP
jgi:hypothetical protein